MTDTFSYIWMIPCLPLLGTLINLFFNRSRSLTGLIACGAVGFSFLVAIVAFFDLVGLPVDQRSVEVVVYSWITSGYFSVDIAFLIDPLSIIMILVVTGVGLLIHLYSIGYMGNDPGSIRYFTYLNLFMFSMLILVMANNFLLMFIGWEGVGLCSYLLIGFWCERPAAADAGMKAFVVNRVGDFAFIVGMLLIVGYIGSLNYREVFTAGPDMMESWITAVTLLLFIGAIGKSAQVPLHIWLPDAMEGPTPVSALIHAATMVTAGVYMVARCHLLFSLSPVTMTVVAIVGAFTAIFAASIGLVQNDIKRVLAYSTVSQLGYMFLACGVGVYTAGIFHLVTHAFFKALLFMGAGSVIHAMEHVVDDAKDPQDLRNMGGLKKAMPQTYVTMMIATLAIAGIFPLSGFFSKDAILWGAFVQNKALWGIGVIAAFMTAFYMFRLMFLTFHGNTRLTQEEAGHIKESPVVMTIPLILLAILAAFSGFIGIPIIEGWDRFGQFLAPVFSDVQSETLHYPWTLEIGAMLISVAIAVGGLAVAYLIYVSRNALPGYIEPTGRIHRLLLHKYYVDEIYEACVVNPVRGIAWGFWKIIDVVIIDGLLTVMALLVRGVGGIARYLQTGVVQNYALMMVLGAVLMIWYFMQ